VTFPVEQLSELVRLFDTALKRELENHTDLDEVDVVALSVVLARHEQMVLGDKALVEKKDLAAVLDFVVSRGPIAVVESDALDRLFAALREAIARGES
jgi:hypothetical protein